MKVCEIFESIQGEGRYTGVPALFIRLSGCTRNCVWCDSKYHKEGKEMSVDQIIDIINKSKLDVVIWSGGEPMIQKMDIISVIVGSKGVSHNLETNGDLLEEDDILYFDHVCISPKDKKFLSGISWIKDKSYIKVVTVKVVTDLVVNKDLIPYATMLMPLTVCDDGENIVIRRNVWNYCVEHNIRYSPRLHVEVWGVGKRKV